MTRHPEAIIFDMDGLLVDSESVWSIVETAMIEARGHRYTNEAREQVIGLRLDEFLPKLHAIYNFKESVAELQAELTSRMLELIPHKVKPQPGARELVEYVVEHNIPRAIASSSPTSIIDATVISQGWGDIFAVRCSADDEKRGKPAPDVYLTAARKLGVKPANCLTLEDSPAGARAAVAAGMICYAVPDPTHTHPGAFRTITPHVFDNLHTVLAQLKNNP